MTRIFLAIVAAAGLWTLYLALFFDAASPLVMLAYVLSSVGAWIASVIARRRVRWIKAAWVVVSLAVIFAIVSGPLDFLRLP